MKADCVFCKIVTGEFESSIVYEDQDILAFLDIHPINPGHILVIPKKHSVNIYDITSDELQKIAKVSQVLSLRIKKVLKAEGISIFQMNEKAGNQDVMHYHLHIIPRAQGDWFHVELQDVAKKQLAINPPRSELNSIAEKIKNEDS
jgi:histidine triad (HIT) family protein